jgi:heat shock protein HtpX
VATIYTHIGENKRKTVYLIGTFLVLIIGIGWGFSYAYNEPLILWLAVLYSTIQVLISYYYSDKIALAISRAKPIDKKDDPTLFRTVENLSIASGLPMPKIYVISDSAPNAFATGRDPRHASIAVTTGLLQKLDKDELTGVIAHELSHVGNYDIRVMTLVVVLVGIIALLSDWFLRFSFYSRRDDRREGGGIMIIVALILALLAPLIATFIQLAVSRRREFLADASGALLTRDPGSLASALEKISKDKEPLEVANKATAHLYIDNPLKEHQGERGVGWFANLFNTHPPVAERIKRLKAMAL